MHLPHLPQQHRKYLHRHLRQLQLHLPPSPTPAPPPPSPTPAPVPEPTPAAPQQAAGSIQSFLSSSQYYAATGACVSQSPSYASLINGFSGTAMSGANEVALMMGNLALESAGFSATKSYNCNQVYCGRGYIQLTGLDNYQAAANALGRPDIVSNPDVVSNDPDTNWAVAAWYWRTRVQGTFSSMGVNMKASILAIDPDENCPSHAGNPYYLGPNMDRVHLIQCFQQQWTGRSDTDYNC
ncbi:lysozyme-like protein [Rhizoclosmatium globosum]|uniref:Lysozyme-like protein n=1 Tax=Rhizoclosmatium globosum TaxID=329046 RepID=A0A1Y2C9U2_9FUNG|nr:lysozyme-like protein [Rhizoclosmatium globosum]|eukprot:ORY43706.1 lysozyme-like protein [Rhizoclosmatium globosum]